ncbi:MAG: ABC transporter ATP-binding protein [Planctomycetes bacterium]|nr:ABC transporter ATP-binding protein [Planctomycetota bacterium]
MQPIVACRDLGRRFDAAGRTVAVLSGIDLEVLPGEFVAIVGPSGSGKSTLLGLLAGLDRPTSGEVVIAGQRLRDLGEAALAALRRDHIGFVFQSFQLLDNLTALENVLIPLELLGTVDADRRSRELLREVGLQERLGHYPSQLSGGEQQRVAIARAFGTRPALLLADEPTGNLDREGGFRVLELLLDLRAAENTALILVTHDPEIAARADRVVRLESGHIVAESPPNETTPTDEGSSR